MLILLINCVYTFTLEYIDRVQLECKHNQIKLCTPSLYDDIIVDSQFKIRKMVYIDIRAMHKRVFVVRKSLVLLIIVNVFAFG